MLPPPSAPRANVLIIDDDPGVRDVCTTLLHALGYKASEAKSGDEALRTLHADGAHVELALVDMEMPDMLDGSLLEQLKRDHPGLRVLLMSGRPRNDLRRYVGSGAHAVIEKPFRLGELDQLMDAALRN
jgi:DNA-binding NtrC family response regulator